MFSTTDTVVAIATPAGRGAIGVVRLSGPEAHRIAQRLTTHGRPFESRLATVTLVHRAVESDSPSSRCGETIDQIVATYFPGPASYTGDDIVELSAHGSPVVLRHIVEAAVAGGARLAEPGEFTLRAYLNGRIDLMQAEAVADLVDSVTPLQARAAFDQFQGTLTRAIGEIDEVLFDLIARLEASIDFPDEGYHFIEPGELAGTIDDIAHRTAALIEHARQGRLIREGLQVAIVGKPNVGKSSLFNALAGAARAIVTGIPGTTRDLVTETVDFDGLAATLVDTAGLRTGGDEVEAEGVSRTVGAASVADLVLLVVDRSATLSEEERKMIESKTLTGWLGGCKAPVVVVANKSDLEPAWHHDEAVNVSALGGTGLNELRAQAARALELEPGQDRPAITNLRHITLVERAHAALGRARTAAFTDGASLSEEFVLADLGDARLAFEEVTGRRAPDEVIARIFSRFCIGK